MLLEHKTWFDDRKTKIRVNRQQQSQVEFIWRKKLTVVNDKTEDKLNTLIS